MSAASAQDVVEESDKTDEPAALGESEPKNSASAQKAGESISRAGQKEERPRHKTLERWKRRGETLWAQKEDSESTAKTRMSPGKAAAIAVSAVLLAEAVLVTGHQMTRKNTVSFPGPEVTASVSEVGDIPNTAESVLIIARVKDDDGVERDIALGKFSPSV